MTQQVQAPATELDILSLIPRAHRVEGERWLSELSSDHRCCSESQG